MIEIVGGSLESPAGMLQLASIQERKGARQPSAGPAGDGQHHLQVAQQLHNRGIRNRRGDNLAPRLQKQLRLRQDPWPCRKRSSAPGRIQFARLAGAELLIGEDLRHPPAVIDVGARQRDEIFHGHVGSDFAVAHPLLNRLGQKLDQGQAPRNPTHAPVKLPGQTLQVVSVVSFEFGQQPALLKRALPLAHTQRLVQDQGLRFAHVPDRHTNGVPAQTPQRRYALVAVDDPVGRSLGIGGNNHHDRCLLTRCGQRGQQFPLPVGTAHAQVRVSHIELVKFHVHRPEPRTLWRSCWHARKMSRQTRDMLSAFWAL